MKTINFSEVKKAFFGGDLCPQHVYDNDAFLSKMAKRVGGSIGSHGMYQKDVVSLDVNIGNITFKLMAMKPRKNSNLVEFKAVAQFTATGFVFEKVNKCVVDIEIVRIENMAQFKKEFSKLATRTKKVVNKFVKEFKDKADRNEKAKGLYMMTI